MPKQTKIVIAGSGFAGLLCALKLEKRYRNNRFVTITLLDRHDYHLFTPNLYEVVAAEEEFTSVSQLKKSVAVPFREILAGKSLDFAKGEITAIENRKKIIRLGAKAVEYDYLVLALGTVPNYLNIPGAREFSLPLRGLADALRIRNSVEFLVQSHRLDPAKKTLHIVIAGGGGTGVELAGALAGLADRVAWKNNYPRESIKITILESSSQVLNAFGGRAGQDALLRLKELGVSVDLGKYIYRVERQFVEFLSTERIGYDLLVWDTGEKGPDLKFETEAQRDGKGRLKTNQNLQLIGSDDIFALGDLGVIIDASGKESSGCGVEHALAQAQYVAQSLPPAYG